METIDITCLDNDLATWEWDLRKRTAEALARGARSEDPRDLARLAEGYLLLLQAVEDGAASYRSLDQELEDLKDERKDDRIGKFSIDGQIADVLLVVPLPKTTYDRLVSWAQLHKTTREQDEDTGAALVALSILYRDSAQKEA